MQETVAEVKTFADRLRDVPIPARQLLSVCVGGCIRRRIAGTTNQYEFSPHEIREATGIEQQRFMELLQILDKHGFICQGFPDDFDLPRIELKGIPGNNRIGGWQIWGDLRTFCKTANVPLDAVVVDLDFTVLD